MGTSLKVLPSPNPRPREATAAVAAVAAEGADEVDSEAAAEGETVEE
jgi:hypothetical protein